MNVKSFVTDERAISNLIATLILIAVAVVGGAFAYTAFREQAGSTTTSADLQVQNLEVVDVTDGQYASITVKNVGTQRLVASGGGSSDAIEVDIQANDTNEMTIDALDPGQTGSAQASGLGLTAGKEYVVQITTYTPDGGSITKTMTVQVKS